MLVSQILHYFHIFFLYFCNVTLLLQYTFVFIVEITTFYNVPKYIHSESLLAAASLNFHRASYIFFSFVQTENNKLLVGYLYQSTRIYNF